MSRHKLVKALDLDEELDDFEGGTKSDDEEEVSAEDKGIHLLLVIPEMCAWFPVRQP